MKLKTRRKIVSALVYPLGVVMGVGIGSVSMVTAKCLAPNNLLGQLVIGCTVYGTGLILASPAIDKTVDKLVEWAYKDATMQEVHEVIVERTKET